jgi:hypothetical protein
MTEQLEQNKIYQCHRAVIQARKIMIRKLPKPGTGRHRTQEAIAETTVRIRVERAYKRTGSQPLSK